MASEKPLVCLVGATGWTGTSLVKGLVKSGNFRVTALIRPASANKPEARELLAQGVEVRLGDLSDGVEKLTVALVGVDIVVSTVPPWLIPLQKSLFAAAKVAGVKRVVPADFASGGARGQRALFDMKLDIRDYVQELGIPYTFIDVGWWMQLYLPLPLRSAKNIPEPSLKMSRQIYGTGDVPNLMTDLNNIGAWVARILADPRTLNHAVQIWEDETTQLRSREIGERVSGDGDALKAERVWITKEQVVQWQAEGRATLAKDPTNGPAAMKLTMSDYELHCHFDLSENSLANAKRLGYLDVRELYPDAPKHTLEDFAAEFYKLPEPGIYYLREPALRLP